MMNSQIFLDGETTARSFPFAIAVEDLAAHDDPHQLLSLPSGLIYPLTLDGVYIGVFGGPKEIAQVHNEELRSQGEVGDSKWAKQQVGLAVLRSTITPRTELKLPAEQIAEVVNDDSVQTATELPLARADLARPEDNGVALIFPPEMRRDGGVQPTSTLELLSRLPKTPTAEALRSVTKTLLAEKVALEAAQQQL